MHDDDYYKQVRQSYYVWFSELDIYFEIYYIPDSREVSSKIFSFRAAYSAMLMHAGPELNIHANKHNVVN